MNPRDKDLRRIELEHSEVIDFAEQHYGDHEGINRPKIVRWIAQFPPPLQPLAAKTLREITYFSTINIRSMTRQLALSVYDEYREISRERIYFVPIGPPGAGSQVVARVLRSMREVPRKSIVTMADVQSISIEAVDVLVLVEDFSGTGETIDEWWKVVEGMFLPKEADVVLALLVLNYKAREKLDNLFGRILSVTDLEYRHNVFHDTCEVFDGTEKRDMLRACKNTRCPQEYIRGFGECGLLVCFKHGCPNNSLPILWYSKDNIWQNLFQRRCI